MRYGGHCGRQTLWRTTGVRAVLPAGARLAEIRELLHLARVGLRVAAQEGAVRVPAPSHPRAHPHTQVNAGQVDKAGEHIFLGR